MGKLRKKHDTLFHTAQDLKHFLSSLSQETGQNQDKNEETKRSFAAEKSQVCTCDASSVRSSVETLRTAFENSKGEVLNLTRERVGICSFHWILGGPHSGTLFLRAIPPPQKKTPGPAMHLIMKGDVGHCATVSAMHGNTCVCEDRLWGVANGIMDRQCSRGFCRVAWVFVEVGIWDGGQNLWNCFLRPKQQSILEYEEKPGSHQHANCQGRAPHPTRRCDAVFTEALHALPWCRHSHTLTIPHPHALAAMPNRCMWP